MTVQYPLSTKLIKSCQIWWQIEISRHRCLILYSSWDTFDFLNTNLDFFVFKCIDIILFQFHSYIIWIVYLFHFKAILSYSIWQTVCLLVSITNQLSFSLIVSFQFFNEAGGKCSRSMCSYFRIMVLYVLRTFYAKIIFEWKKCYNNIVYLYFYFTARYQWRRAFLQLYRPLP